MMERENAVVEPETKRRGRPKMTEEEKRIAAEKRRVKKLAEQQLVSALSAQAGEKETFGKERRKRNVSIPSVGITTSDKDYASEIMDTNAKMALDDIIKLSKGQKSLVSQFGVNEARFLVNNYYSLQKIRIGLGNQKTALYKRYGASKADDLPQMEILNWLYNNTLGMENEIKKALAIYTDNNTVGVWLKKIVGIGPVLSAAMISYFDVTRSPSVSHFYSYCGWNDNNDPWLGKEKATKLVNKYTKPIPRSGGFTEYEIKKALEEYQNMEGYDPDIVDTVETNLASISKYDFLTELAKKFVVDHPGHGKVSDQELALIETDPCHSRSLAKLQKMAYDRDDDCMTLKRLKASLAKPPYNQELKTIMFLIGESFVKVSSKEESLYGRIYRERKASEIVKNMNHEFADQAAAALREKEYGKKTDAYKAYSQGMLPDKQIHARARRYAVKLFISHMYDEMYIEHYNSLPPRKYVEVYLEHNDIIPPEVPYTEIDPNKRSFHPSNPVSIY